MQLTEKDISAARAGLQTLIVGKRRKAPHKPARLIIAADNSSAIDLPPQAVAALTEILEHLAAGREVVVTAQPVEYSTQKAADYLRVSRPFLVGLLEKGAMPFRKVGSHRRVLFADLQAYKANLDAQRVKTLNKLTAQAQELGFGY